MNNNEWMQCKTFTFCKTRDPKACARKIHFFFFSFFFFTFSWLISLIVPIPWVSSGQHSRALLVCLQKKSDFSESLPHLRICQNWFCFFFFFFNFPLVVIRNIKHCRCCKAVTQLLTGHSKTTSFNCTLASLRITNEKHIRLQHQSSDLGSFFLLFFFFQCRCLLLRDNQCICNSLVSSFFPDFCLFLSWRTHPEAKCTTCRYESLC